MSFDEIHLNSFDLAMALNLKHSRANFDKLRYEHANLNGAIVAGVNCKERKKRIRRCADAVRMEWLNFSAEPN